MDPTYANAAPLGLVAFGMTTVLLNIHNAGFFDVDAMVLGMGIFYGGIAQVIAGIMQFKRGDGFGTVAFLSYGLFWLSFAAINILPRMGLAGYAKSSPSRFMAWYLFLWGVFTGFLSIGSLRYPKAKQFVFFSLTILFFLLAIGDWSKDETVKKVAGWEGMVCGASAIYFGLATLLNAEFGTVLFPVGGPTWMGPAKKTVSEPVNEEPVVIVDEPTKEQ